MKKILISILISIPIFSASLRILVIDEYGNPLPGVRAVIKGKKTYYAFTAESGVIYLNLRPGNYRLKANLKGFCRKKVDGIKVLPGRKNFYRISLRLSDQECSEEGRMLPSPTQIWEISSFESKETLSMEDGKLGKISYEKRGNFLWKGYELGKSHFLFNTYPMTTELGDYLYSSTNSENVKIERSGNYCEIYPAQTEFNLDWLPLQSLSLDPENPDSLSVYFSAAVKLKGFKTAASYSKLNEKRNILGFDRRVSKKSDLLYLDFSHGNTGLRLLYTKIDEPFEIKYANFFHTPENTPSFVVKSQDFSLYNSKTEGNFTHLITAGMRTFESNEEIWKETGIFNTKTGEESLFGNRYTRMRDYYLKGSSEIFIGRLAGAEHIIEAGGEFEYVGLSSTFGSENPIVRYQYGNTPYFLPLGELRYWRVYSLGKEENRASHISHISLYLQDNWGFGNLNLLTGLRYDNYSSGYCPGIREGVEGWDFINGEGNEDIFSRRIFYSLQGLGRENLGLRVGFSYLLPHSFLFKGGLFRYVKSLDSKEVLSYFPYVNGWGDIFWKDVDGNGFPSESEIENYGIFPPPHTDKKAPTPYSDVIILGLEKALPLDINLGIQAWTETSSNTIGFANTLVDYYEGHSWWANKKIPEPGPDGVFGTGDDGTIIYYYFTPTEDIKEFKWSFSSVALKTLDSSSKSLKFYLRRPFKKGFSLYFDFTYTKFKGYQGGNIWIYSPNQVENIKANYGRLSIRANVLLSPISKTYISLFFLYDSGIPYQRSFYVISDQPYPFNLQKITASEKGYRLSPAFKTLNLALSREIKTGKLSSVISLKVNNLFNWTSSYNRMGVQGFLTTDGKFYPLNSFGTTERKWGGREIRLGLKIKI